MYVALLRGINVGGKNLLPMADLAVMFAGAGCESVRTYIQSGNVVFAAPASTAPRLPRVIGERIEEQFGFRPTIMVRTAEDIARVIGVNPFIDADIDHKLLHVGFLDRAPDARCIARLDPAAFPDERFEVRADAIFVHYSRGVGASKLTYSRIDKALGATSTFRNWRTVLRIAEMMRPGAG